MCSPNLPDPPLPESLLPEHFKCPITKEPLYDPAITKQGYTCRGPSSKTHDPLN